MSRAERISFDTYSAVFFNNCFVLPQEIWSYIFERLAVWDRPGFKQHCFYTNKLSFSVEIFERQAGWDFERYAELRSLAIISYGDNDLKQAAKLLEEAFEIYFGEETAIKLMVYILTELGDYSAVDKYFDLIHEREIFGGPDNFESLIPLGGNYKYSLNLRGKGKFNFIPKLTLPLETKKQILLYLLDRSSISVPHRMMLKVMTMWWSDIRLADYSTAKLYCKIYVADRNTPFLETQKTYKGLTHLLFPLNWK